MKKTLKPVNRAWQMGYIHSLPKTEQVRVDCRTCGSYVQKDPARGLRFLKEHSQHNTWVSKPVSKQGTLPLKTRPEGVSIMVGNMRITIQEMAGS